MTREIKYRWISISNWEWVYWYYYYCNRKEEKHWIRAQKDNHFIDIAIKSETVW